MRFRITLLSVLSCALVIFSTPASSLAGTLDPRQWHLDPHNSPSLKIVPERESVWSYEDAYSRSRPDYPAKPLKLALKRYARPGAQAVLLIHGWAQNDRCWDASLPQYSFARFLHSQGFDVWVGNNRNAGTPGFKSEAPAGPAHWTVEDYAISDVPALIDLVSERTRKKPFVIAHSLGAWALEGYLGGVYRDPSGALRGDARLAQANQSKVKGVVTIAGVHGVWWPHSVENLMSRPIRSEDDYYQSNYELELLARAEPLYPIIARLPSLPLSWIGSILNLPLDQIPWIGSSLRALYFGFQNGIISTPVLNMLYYAPNSDAENVRLHARDGLEEIGPRLFEQLGNAIMDRDTLSYYHREHARPPYVYGQVRPSLRMPMLIIGGNRDRMANVEAIYQDGFLEMGSADKQFIAVKAGHLDILNGKDAPRDVMAPVASWMHER